MVADAKQKPPTPQKQRNRHGFRSKPPPPAFSLAKLPDDALLTSLEVAAVTRNARSTVEGWDDPTLEWVTLPGGYRRVTVRSLRAFIASGVRRRRTTCTDQLSVAEKATAIT